MQNLNTVALLVVEIRRHKVSGNKSWNSAIYPWKTDFTFIKWVPMPRIVLIDPKLTLTSCQFQQFPSRGKFFISKFLVSHHEKRAVATPDWSILLKFGQNTILDKMKWDTLPYDRRKGCFFSLYIKCVSHNTLLTLFDMGGGARCPPPKCFWPLYPNALEEKAETWWLLILTYGHKKKLFLVA